MQRLPFDKPGRWFRGNLHTHSTRSDGTRTPEAVARFYREEGYDFLSITDHFMERFHYTITDTTALRTPDFTTLIGAELHTVEPGITSGEIWHLLAVGMPLDFAPTRPGETGAAVAARAMAAGAYVAAAHPAWYSLTEDDVISLGDVHAIEVINGISLDHNDRIDSWYMLDAMMARGRTHYHALATDDAHFHGQHADLLRGWTWVRSEALTPEAILEALKRGEFYSSTGPMIHDVQFRGRDSVTIRCSPAQSIFVTGRGSKAAYRHGNGITEIEMSIRHLNSEFCRITVRDERGGRAWTNPILFPPVVV